MHEHAYAMCVHEGGTKWHAACARANCNEDHWFYEAKLRDIACAYCGSPNHWPIECPLPPHMRFVNVSNRIHTGG